MVDDRELSGLNPYDLMETEAARLDRWFSSRDADGWRVPSRCEGWSVRDVLAHLTASEEYNRACLDGTVQQFLADMAARGVTDLATANDIGVHQYDGRAPEEILDVWRGAVLHNREALRARDGGDIDTSVGPYPARRQAFHLAFELATHADDVGVPVDAGEVAGRIDWEAHFARFALGEVREDLTLDARDGRTHVRGDGVDVEMTDAEFVQAVAARLPERTDLDAATASILSVTP